MSNCTTTLSTVPGKTVINRSYADITRIMADHMCSGFVVLSGESNIANSYHFDEWSGFFSSPIDHKSSDKFKIAVDPSVARRGVVFDRAGLLQCCLISSFIFDRFSRRAVDVDNINISICSICSIDRSKLGLLDIDKVSDFKFSKRYPDLFREQHSIDSLFEPKPSIEIDAARQAIIKIFHQRNLCGYFLLFGRETFCEWFNFPDWSGLNLVFLGDFVFGEDGEKAEHELASEYLPLAKNAFAASFFIRQVLARQCNRWRVMTDTICLQAVEKRTLN